MVQAECIIYGGSVNQSADPTINMSFVHYMSFYQVIGGCGSTTPLSLRKFPLWKIVESPW